MIKMLFEYIKDFDPSNRYGQKYSFLELLIIDWIYINPAISPSQILFELKYCMPISNRTNDNFTTKCSWKANLNDFIKYRSHNVYGIATPNPSVILIELCPDLFPHIEQSNLTQDLANAYYSYRIKPDQDQELYQLIPEEYRENLTDTRPGSKTKPALRTTSTSIE